MIQRLMAGPEKRIKDKLNAMLKAEQVFNHPNLVFRGYGTVGIPDKTAIVCGQYIGIEVKADKTKKPTPIQNAMMKRIEKAGGKCFVVCDDETIEIVRQYIIQRRKNGTERLQQEG